MNLSFARLRETDVNVTEIAAAERSWRNNNLNRYPAGRPLNILSATLNGVKSILDLTDDAPRYTLQSPSVVLIAQGAPYGSRTVVEPAGAQSVTVCVKFRLTDETGADIALADRYLGWAPAQAESCIPLFRRVLNDYMRPNVNRLRLKTDLLLLIDELIRHLPKSDPIPEEFRFLQPAIQHIERDPCDNLPVAALAKLCFISESYFRASFRKYSGGLSATEYRNKLRIAKAQELLDSSLWTTALIAEKLGFYDVSHFYRVYKKFNGTLPKKSDGSGDMPTETEELQ